MLKIIKIKTFTSSLGERPSLDTDLLSSGSDGGVMSVLAGCGTSSVITGTREDRSDRERSKGVSKKRERKINKN